MPRLRLPLRPRWLILLALVDGVMIALLSVGGAYAIWTNVFNNTNNAFSTDTLDPPTSLTASVSGSAIRLDWTATVDTYATGYKVLRSTTQGSGYSQIDTVTPRTATSYTDNTVTAGIRYYYVLRSYYQNWQSANSNEANSAVPEVVTKAATSNNDTAWTSPANAQGSPDNVYATAAPAKNATVNGDWAGFGFDAGIPAGATINKVEILAEYKVSTQASNATLVTQTKVGGVLQGASINDASEPLADFDFIADHTAARAWTRADLLDALFEVTIGARRGSSNNAVTFSLDSVRVRVTYTPP